MSPRKRCVDCVREGVTTVRPLKLTRAGKPVPGPRCATHHRAVLKSRRSTARARHVERTYGITEDEYQRILDAQGGVCFICQRAKGTGRRRLAVDHDHVTGAVRGLLCKPCNRDVLGHLRDDIDALHRAINYLTNPPAHAVVGVRVVPDHEVAN
ncbi:endonuclease VII domain-containing protein [Nocardia cyriacigeorgica]|uniref:endonuclease VII domain-containing protein n=1 Tax=Nocardia cyriacigeorgica TaxID=135487 RepID=UPI002454AED3|nr:endonuclease VII domain-containing protein [Nocardia cyriacigeorgica]